MAVPHAKSLCEPISRRKVLDILATMLVVVASASAADLKGTVINGTAKKPAAGDEVVLVALSQEGMNESARTSTDRLGRFSITVGDTQGSYLVRVMHQGVSYHKMVQPGVKAVAIEVYDVAEKLDGVAAIMDVQRFEATSDRLEVKQLVTMRNASLPPRTLMNDRPFEIRLPPEAQVQSGLVQVEDGQPLKQRPIAGDQKGKYYFIFPIRPGDTRFAVIYQLPYKGEALIEPQIRNPLERFVVMLPKSMKFEPKTAGIFQAMPDTTPDNVQGTAPVKPEQTLLFRISGTGMLQELQGRREQAQADQAIQKARPGGGLGPPIEAPDPLQQHRWKILAGLTVLVLAGSAYVLRKPKLPRASKYRLVVRPVPKQQTNVRINARHKRRVRV
jgi:hypothetical protein